MLRLRYLLNLSSLLYLLDKIRVTCNTYWTQLARQFSAIVVEKANKDRTPNRCPPQPPLRMAGYGGCRSGCGFLSYTWIRSRHEVRQNFDGSAIDAQSFKRRNESNQPKARGPRVALRSHSARHGVFFCYPTVELHSSLRKAGAYLQSGRIFLWKSE